MKEAAGKSLFDTLGLKKSADAPETKPLEKPDVDAGEAAKAVLIRLAVPAAVGALWTLGVMAETRLDPVEILPVIGLCALLVAAWWITHWFFAQWRKANKGNRRADAIVIGCRAVIWSLFALVFCIVACVIPPTDLWGKASAGAGPAGPGGSLRPSGLCGADGGDARRLPQRRHRSGFCPGAVGGQRGGGAASCPLLRGDARLAGHHRRAAHSRPVSGKNILTWSPLQVLE